MQKIIALAIMALPALAIAETITFEADSEILVVRGFEPISGMVQFDILGSKDGTVLCVAMDAGRKPMATATGFAQIGSITFTNVELDAIDHVACRYN